MAIRKIQEGTWAKRWSVFLSYKSAQDSGMLRGVNARSVTLVRDPAYPGAGFKAGANSQSFNDVNRNENNLKEEQMAEGEKTHTKEDLDKAVAAAKEEGQKALEKALAAAKAEAQEVLDKAVAAAKAESQDALKGMMPRVEAEKMISAAVEQAKNATIEQITKEKLVSEVAEMQVSAGMIKPEEAEGIKKTLVLKSAAALQEDKALLLRVKTALETAGASAVDKFKKAQLPAQGEGGIPGGFTVGRPDAEGKWGA